MNITVSLSKLVASRRNPRRVKPEREAHRRLVASIKSHDLIEPLVVSPAEEGRYRVIAGNRRLAALRDAFRGEDRKVPCVVRDADDTTAASVSLAENFAREPMHPLDEAEAFARLASVECKGVAAIAAEFGVSETYVRQRMKLAGLAREIKNALRSNEIGVGIAEAFAALPSNQQVVLWQEIGGKPQSAEHVRRLIENAWISSKEALFDVATIDPSCISQDLFGDDVLIKRSAFLDAQIAALRAEQENLKEAGWKEVVIGSQDEVQDRLYRMESPGVEYDDTTTRRLAIIDEQRTTLEAKEVESDEEEQSVRDALDTLDEEEARLIAENPGHHSEATKAGGTVFLSLSIDGRVSRSYRQPRPEDMFPASGRKGKGDPESQRPPTSDDLNDSQNIEFYTHQLLAVREALACDPLARKRLVVIALHDKILQDALTPRRTMTGAGLHAERAEGFQSTLLDAQRARRKETDPFPADKWTDEVEAYQKLQTLSEAQLDALIGVLLVESLTASLSEDTALIRLLGKELSVNVRTHWTPGAEWLAGYRKAQLAHLIGELGSPAHGAAALERKKSDLVQDVTGLFARAATGQGDIDPDIAKRANEWIPATCKAPAQAAGED